MANGKRIENDEEYERTRIWMIQTAIKLDDPLLDPAEKAALMKKYDYVCEVFDRYHRGLLVREYPGLREQYRKLGWEFDELDAPHEQEPPKSTEPPQTVSKAAEKKRTEPATAALADWLDDD